MDWRREREEKIGAQGTDPEIQVISLANWAGDCSFGIVSHKFNPIVLPPILRRPAETATTVRNFQGDC